MSTFISKHSCKWSKPLRYTWAFLALTLIAGTGVLLLTPRQVAAVPYMEAEGDQGGPIEFHGITVTLKQSLQKVAVQRGTAALYNLEQITPELGVALKEENLPPFKPGSHVYYVSTDWKSIDQVKEQLSKIQASPLVKSAHASAEIVALDSNGREIEPFAEPGRSATQKTATPVAQQQDATDYRFTQRKYLGSFFQPDENYKIGGVNVDALRARNLPGGDGSAVRIFLWSTVNYYIEGLQDAIGKQKYYLHRDLPAPFVDIRVQGDVTGVCLPLYYKYSNLEKEVGILASQDTGRGIVGIVPKAEIGVLPLAGYPEYGLPASMYYPTEFYDRLLQMVRPGDVVMMYGELASGYYDDQGPEKYPALAEKIRYLTEVKGVHVIVDSGGGGNSLDDPALNGWYDRNLRDSGAIFVGRVDPETGARISNANSNHPGGHGNYGSRIDLAGWRSFRLMTGPVWHPDSLPTQIAPEAGGYTKYFDNIGLPTTTGVVALVQSIANASGIGPIPPKEMRSLLVETGHTLPDADPAEPIGKYPDADAAVQRLLGQSPIGNEPPTGTLTVPATAVAGKEVSFHVDARDASGGALRYLWRLPDGFVGPDNPAQTVTGFLAPETMDKQVNVEVVVFNVKGKELRLSQPLLITGNLPTVSIQGPESVNAGESVTFTAQVSNLPNGTPRYSWRKPAGFTGDVPNSRSVTWTVPIVAQPTAIDIGLLAGVGMSQATSSKAIIINPVAAPTTPSDDTACAPAWDANIAYGSPGLEVSYGGYNYAVAHWTRNNQPDLNYVLSGAAKPWRRISSCVP